MKFSHQLEVSEKQLIGQMPSIAIIGSTLDERGSYIRNVIDKSSNDLVIEISYDAENINFNIDGTSVPFRDINSTLDSLIGETNELLIDTTTVGVAELLYILRWLKKSNRPAHVKMTYVEPGKYPPLDETNNEFGRHTFNLSSHSLGYKSLPGFTVTSNSKSKSHLIALLGFERVRLGQLLENDEGAFIGALTPMFGVPGFKPSYDKHSAFQNIERILEKGEKPEFSSANNPFETYSKLQYLRSCYPDTVINIAPIGTKPMAIGACLFALENIGNKVGVMYDHPVKKKGRTEGISRVHLFSVLIDT
jgi:hypothetical protein